MKNRPVVSVVIPCYNLGSYLDEAVQSVLDQTFSETEIIVIDDGSTDPATCYLFDSFSRPRTRVIRTENRGLARARNLGIEQAQGQYVCCLDADDLLDRTFLEKAVHVLSADASIAFASMWLRAFGDLDFEWKPESCEFPALLCDDTVCTAALMRREAVLAVGGFDANMPVPGYEDWELAINLVEHGFGGVIIPETLFLYRIRRKSMTSDCTAPDNHIALMRYIVDKHPEAYRRWFRELLLRIENQWIEMDAHYGARDTTGDQRSRHDRLVEETVTALLRSSVWRKTAPLRRLAARRNKRRHMATRRLSVLLLCRNQAAELLEAFDSLTGIAVDDEVIVIDHGSTDPLTLHVLEGFEGAGVRVIRSAREDLVGACVEGLNVASGRYLAVAVPPQVFAPSFLADAVALLENDSDRDFVIGGLYDASADFTWRPSSGDSSGIAGCSRYHFPVVRREVWLRENHVHRRNQSSFNTWVADLVVALSAHGVRGETIPMGVTVAAPKPGADHPLADRHLATLLDQYPAFYAGEWRASYLGHEDLRRRHYAAVVEPRLGYKNESVSVDWGSLRRTQPVSRTWGLDRGLPIDRYYIEKFLERHRSDVRGRVLEVKRTAYTHIYDSGVEKFDVLDIEPENRNATIVADLTVAGSLPADTFDCFVLTQTLHFMYPMDEVIRNAAAALKPGGVLLATLPTVSRIDYEAGVDNDYWRVTAAAARRMFDEAFPGGHVEVEAFGNVLTSSAFLMGIATEELTREELDHLDPYFPMIVCVRAVRSASSDARIGRRHERRPDDVGRAAILMFHSIATDHGDRWNLSIPPEVFDEQMERLARAFTPLPLSQLVAQVASGRVLDGAVAVTFDDGYLDNVTTALPILRRHAIPATFFVSGDGAREGDTFWWEEFLIRAEAAGLDPEDFRSFHARLAGFSPDVRRVALATLPRVAGERPAVASDEDLRDLASDPLVDIGAHGWSHRRLGGLGKAEQEYEIARNIDQIRRRLGVTPHLFAYPFGGPYDEVTLSLLSESGFVGACTVTPGAVSAVSPLLELPRIEMHAWAGAELEAKIAEILSPATLSR